MIAKVLYVDDEPLNLKLFELCFSKKCKVFVANNGFEGLDQLNKETDIMVIISDMKMPGMNGIDFIKQAKEKYPSKKYYIMTGYDINEEIRKTLDSGLILRVLRKPFNATEIDQAISL
jgi:two-component system, response regulator, stage 0 sporulation protein F